MSVERRIPLITIVDNDQSFRNATDSLVRSAGFRSVMFEVGRNLAK